MTTTPTATPARVIPRERLARMLVFTHQHLWQAQQVYNLDRTLAWDAMQNRLLELWSR